MPNIHSNIAIILEKRKKKFTKQLQLEILLFIIYPFACVHMQNNK